MLSYKGFFKKRVNMISYIKLGIISILLLPVVVFSEQSNDGVVGTRSRGTATITIIIPNRVEAKVNDSQEAIVSNQDDFEEEVIIKDNQKIIIYNPK